jgi:16S rRNA (cytidine1402-2'-O)-methyltransferase
MHQPKGKIYLIPCHLSEQPQYIAFPAYNFDIIKQIQIFLVENERSARRFISSLKMGIDIDKLTLIRLDKDTTAESLINLPNYVNRGMHIGVLSEAGCPGVADPGSIAVQFAHKNKIEVIPLIGPSSILLLLMASGFNGQNFAFHGYLPIDKNERKKAIIRLENEVYVHNQTQIFIETPFRNKALVEDLLKNLSPKTLLCIGTDITGLTQKITTMSVKNWRSQDFTIEKVPAIFAIYKEN